MSPESPDVSADDSIEIEPQPLDEVVRRAILLISLVRRAALEEPSADAGDQDAFERETDRFELSSWAMKELGSAATPPERALLRTPAGELSPDDIDMCLASVIPAQALRWALGAAPELGIEDTPESLVEGLLDWGPSPWDEVSRFERRLVLREEESLAAERERWELWHWRASLTPEDMDPGASVDVVVSEVASEAQAAGIVDTITGDFAAYGVPFGTLAADDQVRIAELAEGYLVALNWVCGFGDSWDDVPLYPD